MDGVARERLWCTRRGRGELKAAGVTVGGCRQADGVSGKGGQRTGGGGRGAERMRARWSEQKKMQGGGSSDGADSGLTYRDVTKLTLMGP